METPVKFSAACEWHKAKSSRYDFTIDLDSLAGIFLEVLPIEYAPYSLIYSITDNKSKLSYVFAEISEIRQVLHHHTGNLHLASHLLTDLAALKGDPMLESSLNLNGAVLFQWRTFAIYPSFEESSMCVNSSIQSSLTSDIREFPEYGKIFRLLKAAIKKKAHSRIKGG